MTSFRLGYRPELDGIRGIAMLTIMFYHAEFSFIRGGNICIDIFFVLSGFLITSLLLQEHSKFGFINLKNFYIRRALRLMPALLLFLGVYLVFSLLTKSPAGLSKALTYIFYAVFYLSDIAYIFGLSTMGPLLHTWSLSIEEHFYLIFPPVLVFLLKRTSLKNIFYIFGGVIGCLIVYRSLAFEPVNFPLESYARYTFGFDYRADGLLIGCLLAILCVWKGLPKIHWIFTAAGLSVLFSAIIFLPESSLYFYALPILNLTIAILIIHCVNSRPKLFTNPAAVWIGRVSYSLYLWHFIVFSMFSEFVSKNPLLIFLVGGAISLVITTCSFYLIEKPCLKLKERFSPPKTEPLPNAPAIMS